MIDLTRKSALILGGMNALSGAVAAGLADAGAGVTLLHAREDADRAAQFAPGFRAVVADLDDPARLTEQVAALGPIQIAVISPRWYGNPLFLASTAADWEAALEQNFAQATWAAQAAARLMIAQGAGGRIIFLSSVAALMPFVRLSTLGTSLAALRALAKMAAVDLAPHNITVNVVAAGWVEDGELARLVANDDRRHVEAGIPLGRLADAGEIAGVCCFLASDLASYITGAVIPADGGYTLTRSDGSSPFEPHPPAPSPTASKDAL